MEVPSPFSPWCQAPLRYSLLRRIKPFRLHAGCRLVSLRTSSKLIPEDGSQKPLQRRRNTSHWRKRYGLPRNADKQQIVLSPLILPVLARRFQSRFSRRVRFSDNDTSERSFPN